VVVVGAVAEVQAEDVGAGAEHGCSRVAATMRERRARIMNLFPKG
jgi:hypothetical protein